MPTFSSKLPSDSQDAGYRLIRTPPAAKLAAHVISEQLIGCHTHFVGNRTVPCERPSCDPCNSGITSRWHGYLLIQIDTSQEVVIFETTKRAAAAFDQYHQRHGTTRGCHFQASRLNQKPNGRVLIQTKTGDLTRVNLPPAKDLAKLMCHIWNIAPLQTEVVTPTPARPDPDLRIHRDRPELKPDSPTKIQAAQAAADLAAAAAKNGERETAQ